MPIKGGALTAHERRFAKHYGASGDPRYAAVAAGYSAPQTGYEIAKRPAVLEEAMRVQQERIAHELLPAAVDCLLSIMRNEKAPAGARVSAAKVTLDHALGSRDDGQAKEPHEMTAEELDRAIRELQRLASDRAKAVVIEAEPQPEAGVFG